MAYVSKDRAAKQDWCSNLEPAICSENKFERYFWIILPYAKPKFQAKLWYHSFDVSYLVWLLRSVFWWLANSDMTSGSISNSSFFLFNRSSNMESLSSKLPTIKVVSSFGKDSLPISESIISMSSCKHKIGQYMKISWS